MGFPPPTRIVALGSACTGTDGATNRTYTATRNLARHGFVVVNSAPLMETIDYTVSGRTITFLNPIGDADNIEVHA